MSKNHNPEKHNISVGEVVEKTEDFVTKYQKPLIIGISAVVVLVLAFFAYKKLYKEPREEQAREQIYMAEQRFLIDSFRLALNGEPGSYDGFVQVIDSYGSTKTGNLAHYYAGICQLQMGNFKEAIDYLKKYSGNDEIVKGKALCAIGDCYVELNDYKEAAGYFMKAADHRNNSYAAGYLMKAALAYEAVNQYSDALKAYERVELNYPNTPEAYEAVKEVVRVKILSEKK